MIFHGSLSSLIFRVCLNTEQHNLKAKIKRICYGLSGFSSIGRASPCEEEVPGSTSGSEHFSSCWYLINYSSTEFALSSIKFSMVQIF